jgi:hypothetical protein
MVKLCGHFPYLKCKGQQTFEKKIKLIVVVADITKLNIIGFL